MFRITILSTLSILLLCSCKHRQEPVVDVVSSATLPHDKIVFPPTNANYTVLGHVEGIKNYVVQYDDHVYRGGSFYLGDLAAEALHSWDIKTVISIAPSDEETALCASNGFSLVEIPFTKDDLSAETYRKLFKALEQKDGPFYVHCKGGSHRAGILGAAYRIGKCGWSFDQAVLEYGRLGGDLKTDHVMIESLRTIKTESK